MLAFLILFSSLVFHSSLCAVKAVKAQKWLLLFFFSPCVFSGTWQDQYFGVWTKWIQYNICFSENNVCRCLQSVQITFSLNLIRNFLMVVCIFLLIYLWVPVMLKISRCKNLFQLLERKLRCQCCFPLRQGFSFFQKKGWFFNFCFLMLCSPDRCLWQPGPHYVHKYLVNFEDQLQIITLWVTITHLFPLEGSESI